MGIWEPLSLPDSLCRSCQCLPTPTQLPRLEAGVLLSGLAPSSPRAEVRPSSELRLSKLWVPWRVSSAVVLPLQASRKTKKKEGGALRAQRASSNVFSNFEQTQIQEFKEAFTLMDQNRDGFIDKEDLKDTYASLGKTNVKDDELDAMLKEASGPINFTMFLNLFGEKLNGEHRWDRPCPPS
ncbi:hypothetical protein P7K49_005771 [Saguinus oedipus]|uniref:EF-hand domain-containing protein n=1 Tax=Saguinus oedipus TaxID=9490 RepID=A0ABQ9W0H8_SAGOE|nr:hypothetical protein P7K49_005771 [Saguinus oedipus]